MGLISLAKCEACKLLFRQPQEPAGFSERFYQEEYQSSAATVMPSDEELADLLANQFEGNDKNFADKIALLAEMGIGSGAQVLDFGASWGYGVWQLRERGYEAQGFELSRPRAAYGRDKLGVPVSDEQIEPPGEGFDAIFTNHVLEHIPAVSDCLVSLLRMLKPEGFLLAFVPNGSDACRRERFERFYANWGRLHPIYLNDEFVATRFKEVPHVIAAKPYDRPASAALLQGWSGDDQRVGEVIENELMFVVRKPST